MLEGDLSRDLRPVSAPPELWDRVSEKVAHAAAFAADSGVKRRVSVRHEKVWAMAIAAVAVIAIVLWSVRPAPGARAMRQWVSTKSGLTLPFEDRRDLHLAAAHTDADRAQISFAVNGRRGQLTVTKPAGAPPIDSHPFPGNSDSVYSWSMRGLAFTLQCSTPDDLRVACQLCHV